MKRKYEGLISEEREKELNDIEGMTYDEVIEYYSNNPNLLTERETVWQETDLSPEELCQKYDLVDMTNFFISHGVKLRDK